MTTGELEHTRAAWDDVAASYDDHITPVNIGLANEALRRTGLRSGMRFLDVAAGSGALTIAAARRGARVLAIDLSPRMIARLQARVQRERLADVEARIMDGHLLALENDSFDGAGSQFGIMLFPDMPRGLRELVRVTKPGGEVLVVVFGAPPRIEFIALFMRAMQTAVPGFTGPPDDPPPLAFQLQNPDRLRKELVTAGLKNIRVHTIIQAVEFRSAEHLWQLASTTNPIPVAMVSKLSGEQRVAAMRAMADLLRERSGGADRTTLTSEVHIAVGTK